MKRTLLLLIFVGSYFYMKGQSLEIMPGTERVFIDAQYLKFLDGAKKVSLFSRSRATSSYTNGATDLFTGAYLNYTTTTGFGGTVLGRISSNNAGIDAGIHYFKATKSFMIYALPSININDELLYSWFSILRFTPALKSNWKLYTSLELFSAFNDNGHLASVQRIRIGFDKFGYQFGAAVNINESRFADTDVNPGIFIRKQF